MVGPTLQPVAVIANARADEEPALVVGRRAFAM
jgi:hypothetical protein